MFRSIRNISIILLLLGGGLVILLSSSQRPEAGPIRGTLYAVLRPFQEAVSAAQLRMRDIWHGYIHLTEVREENKKLTQEVARLLQERTVLLAKDQENRRLRKLLDLKGRYDFPSVVAQVIGEDASGWYRTFFINRGLDDGVRPDMPATVADGAVGRIAESSASVSKVLLITDPSLSVDCRVARTRDRGVLSGSLEGGCVLRYLDHRSGVKAQDEVVTSGMDGVFPKDIPVGTVRQVRQSGQGLFLEALVDPAADFSKVEEVLIIVAKRGGFDVRPGLGADR
jgi:rod shape-determining protein MreC